MLRDRFDGVHSSDCPDAIAAFEDAVFAVAAHRPIGDALTKATEADPDLVAAHTLMGFGGVMLARCETVQQASKAFEAAQAAAKAKRYLSPGETAMLKALELAETGYMHSAVDLLERHLEDHPGDFLSAKIAHALRFMLGDREGMVKLSGDLTRKMPEDNAGYGFLLGCHAFGLEENGSYEKAERAGKRAVMLQPADSWGLHAVSHVYEMNGRVDEGREWLTAARPVWSQCNNFGFHMAWHLALFHLENSDHEAVLKLYDEEIRPVQTDDFRDMSNAVSMLWRLEQDGVDVGDHWEALAEIARARRTDTTYVFASLHYLLALIAVGDLKAADELIFAMRAHKDGKCDQSRVTRYIGVRVAEALLRMPGHCERSEVCLAEMARRLPAIGGSNAQRDVFVRALMAVALRNQDYPSVRAIDDLRCELRHQDHFHKVINDRMANGPSRKSSAPHDIHPGHEMLVRLM
ncbi:MAG TPA: tetratricopeptide repeat protein [Hyphomicrobiales bacterium]|nr:tetratricopeptide repeat protein [Hyphomicrobiales bacterium]